MKRRASGFIHSVYVRAGLAILISAVTLILAVREVTFNDIWNAITRADGRFVILALLSVAANTLAKTVRWKVILGKPGEKVSLWITLQAILVGQTLNNFYPARIGDLSRVYIVGDRGPGRMYTLGTILVEKLLDTIFYAMLVVMLVFSIPLPGWLNSWASRSAMVLTGASFGAGLLLFFIASYSEWTLKAVGKVLKIASGRLPWLNEEKTMGWLRSGITSLEILKSSRGLLIVVIWLVISWVTALLNNQLALLALGMHLPLTASLLVLVVLQAGISIPSMPGRIGVFEYICVLTLALFGISQSAAFSYGVLLHSLVFIPPTLLGVIFLIWMGLPVRGAAWADVTGEDQ